jgi:hypothetical protein
MDCDDIARVCYDSALDVAPAVDPFQVVDLAEQATTRFWRWAANLLGEFAEFIETTVLRPSSVEAARKATVELRGSPFDDLQVLANHANRIANALYPGEQFEVIENETMEEATKRAYEWLKVLTWKCENPSASTMRWRRCCWEYIA